MYAKMSVRRLLAGCRRTKSNTRGKDVWLFGQTGISNDAQDRRDVRKQCQDKTVNLHSCIDH